MDHHVPCGKRPWRLQGLGARAYGAYCATPDECPRRIDEMLAVEAAQMRRDVDGSSGDDSQANNDNQSNNFHFNSSQTQGPTAAPTHTPTPALADDDKKIVSDGCLMTKEEARNKDAGLIDQTLIVRREWEADKVKRDQEILDLRVENQILRAEQKALKDVRAALRAAFEALKNMLAR